MKKVMLLVLLLLSMKTYALPPGFVYLHDIDPSIQQDIRYAGDHNFIGHPIEGYATATCILTRETALALRNVQSQLKKKGLSLKVYDCYRPTRAVKEFVRWSLDPHEQQMKQEFYPRVDKKDLFKLGYVAEYSGHSRGSTVDLTIVNNTALPSFYVRQPLKSCYAPWEQRYPDNSIDMGTGFDCFDTTAELTTEAIGMQAQSNRKILQRIMINNGFVPYEKEWWHFTLKNEPFKNTYFDFKVR